MSLMFAQLESTAKEHKATITRLTAEVEQNAIDLEEYRRDVERLRAALGRMLLEFDFMVEREVIPDVRNDIIFVEARAALAAENEKLRAVLQRVRQ